MNAYLERKCLELGAQAMSRTRLYLDTNFWIELRNSALESNSMGSSQDLLRILREAVHERGVICTYSSHSFTEIMKHSSEELREATFRLVDELSSGFCIANPDRLLNNEIDHWIISEIAQKRPLLPLAQMGWTRPCFIIVDWAPHQLQIDAEDAEKMHHGFIDSMWRMTLADIASAIHSRAEEFPVPKWAQSAAELMNYESPLHAHEHDSLEGFFLSELNGTLDFAEERIGERYREVAERYEFSTVPSTTDEMREYGKQIHALLMKIAINGRLGDHFPGTQVRSWIIAAIRNDRRTKFDANKLIDYEHAQTALPCCDYFLTDGPHARLLCDAKLNKRFNCHVIGSAKEACDVLHGALRRI